MDVLDVIKKDHEKVLGLIKELEITTVRDTKVREDRFGILKKEVSGHMDAEERVFYPALADQIPDQINKSVGEHNAARNAMRDLDSTPENDDRWISKLMVFGDLVTNHIRQEEGPIFDAAGRAFSLDQLQQMASSFQEAKGIIIVPPTSATSAAKTSVAAASVLGAGAAEAASSARPGMVRSMAGSSIPMVLSAGTLKGDKVRNPQGEHLGKIEEFMIDMSSGCIAYAVLSFGGFLGSKLFAIPWRALSLDTEKHEFILNIDKDRLKNAPGFDKNNWPNMADLQWAESIHAYYDQVPYWRR